ncbi:hypothetical protein CEXT_712761 [Caerostris extrusa]|uniref:Uncharacterized protein n=1 Tax=Caerostris extrusa TaxID=172846 RepID=A0AAV4SLI4_CAEEX|nr:hypothetical protein CEXT_712761 [Caerostris extrusa]
MCKSEFETSMVSGLISITKSKYKKTSRLRQQVLLNIILKKLREELEEARVTRIKALGQSKTDGSQSSEDDPFGLNNFFSALKSTDCNEEKKS